MKPKNLVSIAEYAKLCGVSETVVRKRIANGEIKTILSYRVAVIDVDLFPPQPPRKPGRLPYSQLQLTK